MSDRLKIIAVAGLIGACIVAGAILFYNRGAKPTLTGKITEVRTIGVEQNASVAFVNFSGANSAENALIIHKRELEVVDGDGNRHVGMLVQVPDLKSLFEYFPVLGGMKDEPLLPRTELEPGEPLRGLVAARFEISKDKLDQRQKIILRVYDIRERTSEIEETPQETP